MRKEKKYLAHAEHENDYFSFIFTSRYRANSFNNIADAKRAYRKTRGYMPKITKTVLLEL